MQTPGKRVFSASGAGRAAAARTRKHAHDCTRTYLDHTSFPHIVRAIFGYLPLSELLRVRSTSREYLEFADARLFHHVVAAMPPARCRDIELRAPISPFPRLPFLPWQSAEHPCARRAVRQAARARQLAIVRVVDFGDSLEKKYRGSTARTVTDDVQNVMHEFYDDGFDDATTGEDTLRSASRLIAPLLRAPLIARRRNALEGAASPWISADTYVDYLCIMESQYDPHWFWPGASIEVPPCSAYVLHLAYDPYVPVSMADINIKVPEEIQSIVIVLAPCRFDGPTESVGHLTRPVGIFTDLLTGFLCNIATARLQIVGLENVHRSTLGLELVDPRPEDVLKAARESIPAFIHSARDFAPGHASWHKGIHTGAQRTLPYDSYEHQLDTISRISTPTFDEWEASLSDRERLLLAHPPEYEGVGR